MKRRMPKPLGRRQFLRGAGLLIALPMAARFESLAEATPGVAPQRYVSLFFGNGMPKKFVQNGYSGVLAPLSAFQNKLATLRGLRLPESGGADLHYKGTARFGKGVSAAGESSAGGQSIDNALHQKFGSGSKLLNVNMHTHVTGGNPATRWYHSWRDVNQPNDELLKPLDVFNFLFGNFKPADPGGRQSPGPTPEEIRAAHYRKSVLDTAIQDYQSIMSEASGYSLGVRALISDHLDLVRELEKQVATLEMQPPLSTGACQLPSQPPDLNPSQACSASLCPGDDSFYYGSGGANWNEVWELNSKLYAMALRCGISRFGTMGCSGGGDRYPVPELSAKGITESPHVLAHDWNSSSENGFDECVKWLMEKVAFFLAQLDDPNFKEQDGGTLLDHTLVMIGTELGTGSNGQHAVDYMTYFLAGGGGRIKPGIHDFDGRTDVDLYSTVAEAMGLGSQFGSSSDFTGTLGIVQ